MNSAKEESMFSNFMKNHYRRMLLNVDSKFDINDMTEEEAKDDLIKLLSVKKSKTKIFKLSSKFYRITAIAALLLLFIVFILYFFQVNETPKQYISQKTTIKTTPDSDNQFNKEQNSERKVEEKLFVLNIDSISAPKYYTSNQEVFGFNQATEKKEFNLNTFCEIITEKFPNYNFAKNNNELISKKFIDKSTNEYYKFRLEYKNSIVIIMLETSDISIKNKATKESTSLILELNKIFQEIER